MTTTLVNITRRPDWQFARTPWPALDTRLRTLYSAWVVDPEQAAPDSANAYFAETGWLESFMAKPSTTNGEFIFEIVGASEVTQ